MPRGKKTEIKEVPRVRPNYGNLVVRPIEPNAATPGGIILPQLNERSKPFKGTIAFLDRDADYYNDVEGWAPGKTVYFKPYAAHEIEVDGEALLVISEDDILVTINDPVVLE
jgi:co-chaperonin GroES (HSP10)